MIFGEGLRLGSAEKKNEIRADQAQRTKRKPQALKRFIFEPSWHG
jgi:hypothetical protein